MTSWRRAALGSGGAVAVLALAAAVALHALVDPGRLKEIAREKVQEEWGRDLAVGEASLELLPFPALRAESVALSNAEWAEAPHFLRADRIDARLELLPLLVGKVRLKSLDLEGVTVELETRKDGVSNAPPAPGGKGEGTYLALTFLRVRDATIHIRGEAPATWRIAEATLDAAGGMRDASIKATLEKDGKPLGVSATFDDLSRFGRAGATSGGKVDLDWGRTRVALSGRLPLGPGLRGHALAARVESTGFADLCEFFALPLCPRAALAASFEMRDDAGATEIPKLDVTLGKLRVVGEARLAPAAPGRTFAARLEAERMDWVQTMLDLGGPVIPPLAPDEMFHDVPLAWPLLVGLRGTRGTLDVRVRNLKLRNGVELNDAASRIAIDGDRMTLDPYSAFLLGGSAKGRMLFEGGTRGVKVEFDGTGLLLERWFSERGSRIPLSGGPMRIGARLSSSGNTMKALAAAVTGPIDIHMGPAAWTSEKAGDAEAVMTNAFAPKGAGRIDFECAVAVLPFANGVASGDPLVGFRTAASALITAGNVDLRRQTLELRGRLRPKSGVHIGLASIAGDMIIEGPMRRPKMALDPAEKPAAVARAAAAVATLGLSAAGTAAYDAAKARENDPCRLEFKRERR